MKPVATATYKDCWKGEVPIELVPYRTKRRGQRITCYRWSGNIGLLPFASIARAINAARGHALVNNVQSI